MSVLFADRADAGRQLAAELVPAGADGMVVVGLARGGVPLAAEIAGRLSAPCDALAVRKVGFPHQPEYGIGGVASGDPGVYIRSDHGLTEEQLHRAIEVARSQAGALDAVLHRDHRPLDVNGKTVLLVDDGLATGVTMIAAVRWARARGAASVIVAVPVAASSGIRSVRREVDGIVCPHILESFGAVGSWYQDFTPVTDAEVMQILDQATRATTGTEPA